MGILTRVRPSRPTRPTLLIGLIATYVLGTLAARRRGYNLGRNVIVRCRRGHLFTTVWVPGMTLKSLKLGWWRLQWCPVGRHVSLVHPVKVSELNDEERRFAEEHRDVRLP
jgi:hypothetical protein